MLLAALHWLVDCFELCAGLGRTDLRHHGHLLFLPNMATMSVTPAVRGSVCLCASIIIIMTTLDHAADQLWHSRKERHTT